MSALLSIVIMLIVERTMSLKSPNNIPPGLPNKINTNTVKSELIPMLQQSMVESRVHLLGNGDALNMLESLKEEMLGDVLSIEDPIWKSVIMTEGIVEPTSWSSLPEKVAERYFSYKLSAALEANSISGNQAVFDCFLDRKLMNLKKSQPFLEEISGRLPDIIMSNDPLEALETFLFVSLWGMQKGRKLICSDDSITGTAKKRRAFADGIRSQMSYLVKNEMAYVLRIFAEGKSARGDVSIILGNTGQELVADLALAYTLITLDLCETVTFHTKKYTTNQFGATSVDVYGHIEHLADPVHSSVWAVRHFGEALRTFIYGGRLKIEDDEFWCLPTPMWDMPPRIESKLGGSRLVIVKGEENYSRMLGNRCWPLETASSSILEYWHVPVCALRILESEIGCGLDEAAVSQAGFNRAFMTSGRWGLVQFYSPTSPVLP